QSIPKLPAKTVSHCLLLPAPPRQEKNHCYCQRLSQHLIYQTVYQNPNQSNGTQYAGKMYSLGSMFRKKIPPLANSFTRFLVLYLMKSRSKKMPLKHLDWNPTSQRRSC
ncbi:hypothetical protein VP01_8505g1, partial [Puccinia sorghi]